jgi:hypothetical protein
MKMKKFFLTRTTRIVAFCLTFSLFFISCKKDPIPPTPTANSGLKGIYVLNQGVWNMNNCSLSYYDFENEKMEKDIFLKKNGRGLGDTGNDLKKYGSKLYIIMSTTESLEIVNADNCKSIKQILLTGKGPQFIAFHQNKAYVSCQDGSVLCIDTTSLEIERTTMAGNTPAGICVANGKLYVANSGGLNFPDYDNTVSVIDLNSFTEIKKIEVVLNPYLLQADMQGNVYLVSNGNYNDIPSSFQRINSQTDEVVKTFDFAISNFTIHGNYAYLYSYDFVTETSSGIKVLDLTNDTFVQENFIKDGTKINTPYCIAVNSKNLDVYITDVYDFTTTGDVYCFSKEGKKKFSLEVGINPSSIVFIK